MKRWNEGYKYALPVILAVMLIFGTAGNCFASAGVLLMVQGKVTVDAKLDPTLIGGLVVRVGSRMIDASLKSKLQRLQLAMKGAQ